MMKTEYPSELVQEVAERVNQFAPVEIERIGESTLYKLVVAGEICLNYATADTVDIYLLGVARGHRLATAPPHPKQEDLR